MYSTDYVYPTVKYKCPKCQDVHVVIITKTFFTKGNRVRCISCEEPILLKEAK